MSTVPPLPPPNKERQSINRHRSSGLRRVFLHLSHPPTTSVLLYHTNYKDQRRQQPPLTKQDTAQCISTAPILRNKDQPHNSPLIDNKMPRKKQTDGVEGLASGHVVRERTRAHSHALHAISVNTSDQKAVEQQGIEKKDEVMNGGISMGEKDGANVGAGVSVDKGGTSAASNKPSSNVKTSSKRNGLPKEKDKTTVTTATPRKQFNDPYEQSVYNAAIAHLKRKADAKKLKKEKKAVPAKTQTQVRAPQTTKAQLDWGSDVDKYLDPNSKWNGKSLLEFFHPNEDPHPNASATKTTNNAVSQDAPRTKITKLKLNYYPNGKKPEREKSSVSSDTASSNQQSSSPSKAQGSILAAQGGRKMKAVLSKVDIPPPIRVPGPKTAFIRGSRANPLTFSRPVRAVEKMRSLRFAMRPQGTRFFDGTWTEHGTSRSFPSGASDSSGLTSPPPSSPPAPPQKRKRNAPVPASDNTESTDGDEMMGHTAKRVKMT